jgi:membrane protein YqaA with SNARE-associated domain
VHAIRVYFVGSYWVMKKYFRSKIRKIAPTYESFLETRPVLHVLAALQWPRKKIRQLYGWVVGWAETKNATRALAVLSFAESSFFPIPPDPLLIATTTVKPKNYLKLATITTIASVLGGIVGYGIGLLLFSSIGQGIIDAYHLQDEFIRLGERYNENALLAIFTAAFTPIPYKLITISAGVFSVNFIAFIAASILGRGARFFTVAYLMHHFGKRYKDKIEKYIDLLSLAFVALLVIGVLVVRYI